MFRIESRGGAIVWRQGDVASAPPPAPTGSYAPRGKWTAGGRRCRAQAYSHVSVGESAGATAAGASLIATASFFGGTATAGTGAAAQGATLIVNALIQGGSAQSSGLTVAQGVLFTVLPSMQAGSASSVGGLATAQGAQITVAASIRGGVASNGSTFAVLGSLVGTVQTGYPRRPSNRQLGRRY